MSHQEDPKIKMLGVKLSQKLYRSVEKEAAVYGMPVSEYVRHLIGEKRLT